MSHELIYTSAPRGVKPGSKGFCTVACTADLPESLAALLENLSDYRIAGDAKPVAWSHLRIGQGLREDSVLSRKAFALDHDGRQGLFAHHVVLGAAERPRGGPAWVLGQRIPGQEPPDFMHTAWDEYVGIIPAGRKPLPGDREAGRCTAWERSGLDPGWAGVLAETFIGEPGRLAYLVYRPGRDLLPLIQDAIALLPPDRRWSVTFSTYFTGLPANIPCAWRGVLAGSSEAQRAARQSRALILDLDALGEAQGGELVALARTGIRTARPAHGTEPGRRAGAARRAGPVRSTGREPPTARPAHEMGPTLAESLRGEARRPRRSVLGLAAALALLVGLSLALLAWFLPQGDHGVEEALLKARKQSKDRATLAKPSAALAQGPAAPEAPDKPPVVSEAKPAAPKATPPPAAAPTRDPAADPGEPVTRFANVSLPRTSTRRSLHDSSVRTFNVDLPRSDRYTLRLRGLEDPELADDKLIARDGPEGQGAELRVVHDPLKGVPSKKGRREDPPVLARFWVEGGRLKFQWAAEFGASLAEPARALRDCILVVHDGRRTTVNLVLRQLLVDPGGLTVEKVTLPIDWKGELDRPRHRLVMQACRLRDGKDGKGWRDLPPVPEPNRREFLILSKRDEDGVHDLSLSVSLAENGSEVRAALKPALPAIRREVRQREEEVKVLTDRIKRWEREAREGWNGLRPLDADLKEARTMLREVRAQRGDPGPGAPDGEEAAPLREAEARVSRLEHRREEIIKEVDRLRRERGEIEQVRTEAQGRLVIQQELRREADRYQALPIQVRLGIVIDGQECDVARIGPE
jgi:hypothetical protein